MTKEIYDEKNEHIVYNSGRKTITCLHCKEESEEGIGGRTVFYWRHVNCVRNAKKLAKIRGE